MLPRLFNTYLPFRTIRGRFSATMGVSGILFGLMVTGFMAWRWEASMQESARASLQLTAHKIARSLLSDLDQRQQAVSLLAELIGTSNLTDPDAIRSVFNNLRARQPEYAWIGLTDARGKVMVASGGQLEQQNAAARPWFQAGLRGIFLGDPHEAKLLAPFNPPGPDGELVRFVDVAVPVRDAGQQTVGVVGAHLYWHWVQGLVKDALKELNRGTPVEVLIANRDGSWMLKPPTETAVNLAALNAQTQTPYFSASADVISPQSPDGLTWTVIVREETRHTLAPIVWNRQLMVAFSIVGAALFAWVTWLICGWVVQPIVALAKQARTHQSYRDAQPLPTPHKRTDETAVLGTVMHKLAYYDAVSGLANRRLLIERLNVALQACARGQHHGAILLINLDNFSLLNDTRGHEVGDRLLLEVAERLPSALRNTDTLARLGSDEFVVLRTPLHANRTQATQESLALADKVLKCFEAPFQLIGETYRCQASIGIALFDGLDTSAPDVFKHVDMAMFEAKRSGGQRAHFFDDSLQTQLTERFVMENHLRQAIPSELSLAYQKQVDAHGAVLGAEVLLRWQHPQLGQIFPIKFIPLAEETGLIVPLGRWVLQTACTQIHAWEASERYRHLVLAVNVSAKEFGQPDYVDQVLQIVRSTGANPQRLKLELTESVLADDVDGVVHKMNLLKAQGIQFSLDDFGTGFSSLAYLKRMPLDQLKIDKSFVQDVVMNPNDASIVRTVIALGLGLGLAVIAEGVETDEQAAFLRAHGCHHFQGYLFSRPVPLVEFEAQVPRTPPTV